MVNAAPLIGVEEEYVNVFHSKDYVQRKWSKWFSILNIVPGYIFTHDLVVLKRVS